MQLLSGWLAAKRNNYSLINHQTITYFPLTTLLINNLEIREIKMMKYLHFTPAMLAILLAMAAGSANAEIDYQRLVWDQDPAHKAVIGFNQTDSSEKVILKYGYTTDENSWLSQGVANTEVFNETFTSSFVRLTGLTANSPVYYRICEGSTCGERMWFKTAPIDDTSFVMLAGGDTRTGWETRRLGNKLLAKIRPLFIMHGGDYTGENNAIQMKEFFNDWKLTFSDDTINGMAYKRIYPLVPTHGNHEDKDYQTLCRVFGVDFNADGLCTTDDTYGAFDVSPLLRIYTLNSQYQQSGWSKEGEEQASWLASDLAAKGDKVTWRFAQYHKPFYPHLKKKGENPQLFSWWAKEFYQHGLNIAFESDTHLNKVTHAVKPVGCTFEVTTSGGTIYAGEGSWGADARSVDKVYDWTLDAVSIQQFKIITVTVDSVGMRTAQFDSGATTISAKERSDDPTVLPKGVNWWRAKGIGEVLTLTRNNAGQSIIN